MKAFALPGYLDYDQYKASNARFISRFRGLTDEWKSALPDDGAARKTRVEPGSVGERGEAELEDGDRVDQLAAQEHLGVELAHQPGLAPLAAPDGEDARAAARDEAGRGARLRLQPPAEVAEQRLAGRADLRVVDPRPDGAGGDGAVLARARLRLALEEGDVADLEDALRELVAGVDAERLQQAGDQRGRIMVCSALIGFSISTASSCRGSESES